MQDIFKDGLCPMLFTDAIERYKLSEEFIMRFCNKGCSVECGRFLREELERQEKND